jgi:CDP-diacylglycerol---glycerol-3-phosphate 3-phosphatidyltransferase
MAASITRPAVFVLSKTSLSPNAVTLIGFAITLAAAALAGTGHIFAAGWVMLLAGCFDILDGALARRTNRVTKFGGVLDSTLDRISEAVILVGLTANYLYYNHTTPAGGWIIILLGIALTGSFLVSYIRSRAEAAGVDCQVGVFTRAERVVILALGLLLGAFNYVLVTAIAIITCLSLVTMIQRLVHVYHKTKT